MTDHMAKTLNSSDAVTWKSHGGEAPGKVVKKITAPTEIKGHKVAASKDNPEFIVETTAGKRAAQGASAEQGITGRCQTNVAQRAQQWWPGRISRKSRARPPSPFRFSARRER